MITRGAVFLTRAFQLLAAAAVCLSATACRQSAAAPGAATSHTEAGQSLVLLTGPSSGAYSPLGHALADAYNERLGNIRVTAATTEGPEGAGANAQAIVAGEADLAFSRADIAYQVFRQVPTPGAGAAPASHNAQLRSLAVVYTNAVHLLVRRASGIKRGADMRGHRVQISDDAGGGGGLSRLARMVVEAYGLGEKDVTAIGGARNAISRLKSDQLDVRIFASAYPLAGIDDLGPSSQLALLSLEPEVIDRLRSRVPFFKPTIIPRGTYNGQTEDVLTVGIDGLLLCRDSLPEAVVYDLTRTLFEALPELARTQKAARLIDVVNAPATPVPLHPGAARYYRERDLFR